MCTQWLAEESSLAGIDQSDNSPPVLMPPPPVCATSSQWDLARKRGGRFSHPSARTLVDATSAQGMQTDSESTCAPGLALLLADPSVPMSTPRLVCAG